MNQEVVVVLMTAGSRAESEYLAEMLVNKRLAACVQIMPGVQSIYSWQGKLQREAEFLLLAKTTRASFAELEREVRAAHSYETPEIIALPAAAVSDSYLQWMIENLKS